MCVGVLADVRCWRSGSASNERTAVPGLMDDTTLGTPTVDAFAIPFKEELHLLSCRPETKSLCCQQPVPLSSGYSIGRSNVTLFVKAVKAGQSSTILLQAREVRFRSNEIEVALEPLEGNVLQVECKFRPSSYFEAAVDAGSVLSKRSAQEPNGPSDSVRLYRPLLPTPIGRRRAELILAWKVTPLANTKCAFTRIEANAPTDGCCSWELGNDSSQKLASSQHDLKARFRRANTSSKMHRKCIAAAMTVKANGISNGDSKVANLPF